jgi:hypothetical protein
VDDFQSMMLESSADPPSFKHGKNATNVPTKGKNTILEEGEDGEDEEDTREDLENIEDMQQALQSSRLKDLAQECMLYCFINFTSILLHIVFFTNLLI